MFSQEIKFARQTSEIIGCAMEVHNALGNCFLEIIYQRALEHEFQLRGIKFKRECEMTITYKAKKIGTRKVDFLVNEQISVEIKALSALDNSNFVQALNYLQIHNLEIGLLINFGRSKFAFHRLTNKHFRAQPND